MLIWCVLLSGPVQIMSAELSHSGRYSCTAKNAAGSTQRIVHLTVQGKDKDIHASPTDTQIT